MSIVKLKHILEIAEIKMLNNYLQSFGSYQQHQQDTPYLENHQDESNSIANVNHSISKQEINTMGFPRETQNKNQFTSTKVATNQNSELSKIKHEVQLQWTPSS